MSETEIDGIAAMQVDEDLVITTRLRDRLAEAADADGMIRLEHVLSALFNAVRQLEAEIRGKPYQPIVDTDAAGS